MRHSSVFTTKLLMNTICAALLIEMILLLNCQIVKLKDEKSEKGYTIYFEDKNFDADKIVTELWASKVIPYITEKANDLTVVLDEISKNKENAGKQYGAREREEGTPWNFIVFGEGTIKAIDSSSRAGKLIVDVPSIQNSEIIFQTGPVMKGTSLRDSFDFLSFDQFTNQIEFANLSNSFNKRIVDDVLKNAQLDKHVGKSIKFYGTFTMPDNVSKILITPVKIEVM